MKKTINNKRLCFNGLDFNFKMKWATIFLCFFIVQVQASEVDVTALENEFKQQQDITVKGTITSAADGGPLPGATVIVQGTSKGVVTDFDGNYVIKVSNPGTAVLVFSYVGFVSMEIPVNNQSVVNVKLKEDSSKLDEVVVVGFGTQKKESVVGAMSSIKPSELKIPSSNLTASLAGRIGGLISYQTSGEPGEDNAQFFIRGVASFNGQNGPLILIDGIELTVDDLARLQPDDIESFSILKDPTTTAIYGARGANGIVLVTTKSGVEGQVSVSVRVESSTTQPTRLTKLADPITFMQLMNEANRTRGEFPTFTEAQIAGTIRGGNSNIYPANDWYKMLFKNSNTTQRATVNVRGGGKVAKYYVGGSFSHDNGLLKIDKNNNFDNSLDLKQFSLRSNVNVNLHKNTEMIVRMNITTDNYRGPLQGGNAIFNAAVRTSPTRFPAVYEPDESLIGVPHILYGNGLPPRGTAFGGNETNPIWFNPYAELQRGYKDTRRQQSSVTLELKQDLASILPGLSGRFLGNINNLSFFENKRGYKPYFYRLSTFDAFTEKYSLIRTGTGTGSESLELLGGGRENNTVMYMETALNYNQSFGDHGVSGLLVAIARDYLDGNANSVQVSLPSRNIGVSGRVDYDYVNRYFVEFNFGYNGSERFSKDKRFGFFPAFGAGWLISDEPFFKKLTPVINRLKLRASYGWVGNDQIGNSRSDRFFYLSEVNLSDGGRGATFGEELNNRYSGVSISRYANPEVTWELARKMNVGLDVDLFDKAVQLRIDAFNEKRTNILQTRADIPSTLGLQAELKTNVGEVTAQGFDLSLDINHQFTNDLWLQGRGTFTYADNKYHVFEQPDYASIGAPWRSNVGNNVSVSQGYVAERLFVDDEEALNSPAQFGLAGVDYGGGDIKYKDLNGDGVITTLDQAPIGKPSIPKVSYGFGLSAKYKDLDLSVFFQGIAETSFFINPVETAPFINTVQSAGINAVSGGNGVLSENGIIQEYADSHWSEDNRDIYAVWPRLSSNPVDNNTKTSTWWLRDGSFLRLKQVELGYDFEKLKDKLGMTSLRLYLTGTNLVTWSKFKMWDPELKGNGLNYPLQRVFNIGLQVKF